jgi:hypothetical protein
VAFGSIFFGGTSKKATSKTAIKEKMEKEMGMETEMKEPKLKPRLVNLLPPMVTIIALSVLIFFRGEGKADQSLRALIQSVDPAKTMLLALFISLLLTALHLSLLNAYQEMPLNGSYP